MGSNLVSNIKYLRSLTYDHVDFAVTVPRLLLIIVLTHGCCSQSRSHWIIVAVKTAEVDLLLVKNVQILTYLLVGLKRFGVDRVLELLGLTIAALVYAVRDARYRTSAMPRRLHSPNLEVCAIHLPPQLLVIVEMLKPDLIDRLCGDVRFVSFDFLIDLDAREAHIENIIGLTRATLRTTPPLALEDFRLLSPAFARLLRLDEHVVSVIAAYLIVPISSCKIGCLRIAELPLVQRTLSIEALDLWHTQTGCLREGHLCVHVADGP